VFRSIGRRVSVVLFGLLIVGLAGTLLPPYEWDVLMATSGTDSMPPAPKEITRLSCGPHTVLLDQRQTTPVGGKGDPTRLRVFRPDREVWRLNQEAIMEVACRSLTGDGVPGLIITTYSFGAHCCTEIYVLSLGPEPRLLLHFFEGNGGGYEVRDLKGDGSLQLIMNDDSFSYFGGLSYASSPARLPLVACYRNGLFTDCTREFPEVVRDSIESYRADLQATELRRRDGEIEASPGWPTDFSIAGSVLGIYADSVLLGQDGEGWAAARSSIESERVWKWFECNRPTVQRWARQRGEILGSSRPTPPIWQTPGCEQWEPGRNP